MKDKTKTLVVIVLLGLTIFASLTPPNIVLAETTVSKVHISEINNYRGYRIWRRANMDTKMAIVASYYSNVSGRFFGYQLDLIQNSDKNFKKFVLRYRKLNQSLYINDIVDYIDSKYSNWGNTTRQIDALIYSYLVETYKSIDI